MKRFLAKHFDGAPIWGVALWSIAWAAMFLAIIAKI